MKTRPQLLCLPILGAGLALFLVALPSPAEDVIIRQFNDAGELSGWRFDYGGVTNLIEFDSTQDASNNPTSGSLKVTFGFDAAALSASGNNKGAVTLDFSTPLDGSEYQTMEMDLKIAPGSAADGSGNSGFFQMVIRNTVSYTFNSQFGANVTTNVSTNGGWIHISVPPAGARDDIYAITLELFGGAGLTGPVSFYVDNLKFTRPATVIDMFISQFNDSTSRTGWRFAYGGVTNLIGFDSSQDASNNPASGSLKATFGFDAAQLNPAGNNKGALTFAFPNPLNGSAYLSMEMDVKILTGSATDQAGTSGFFQLVLTNGVFYDYFAQLGFDVSTNDGWRHLQAAPLSGEFNDIRAITLELDGGATLTGPVTFYIDNLKFTSVAGPPPGPTMAMERPKRGLNLIPGSGQYERQNIASVSSLGYSWIGLSEPVTYAVTIGAYPDASHNGFQTHLFLVAGAPGTDSAPDYSQPHVVFLDIQNRADGTAVAAFRYKVNEPNGNTFLYGAGTLGMVTNSTPLGTWSLMFDQNTNVTITAPGGALGRFTLPPASAALFADPLTVYLGDQPNLGRNVGQGAILDRIHITIGNATLLDDNFLADEVLDPALWQIAAGSPGGVQLVGSDAAFWLSWTIPDLGYELQSTANATDPNSWINTGWIVPQLGSVKRVLVHSFNLNPDPTRIYAPSPSFSFFRLRKP